MGERRGRGGPMRCDPGGPTRRDLRTLFEVGAPAALTDGQLLERFATRRGPAAERAFEALVDRHGSMVLRACRSILRDDHEAMDAFQATFLVLARRGGSLWVRDSLGPWLHRVACRAAGKARADAARRRAGQRRLAERTPDPASAGDGRRDDLAAILHEEVDRLPERFRAPIVLCDLEGRTCEETARHLGCPVGTVGSRLARGREKLRGRLIRRGVAPTLGAAVSLGSEPAFAALARAPFPSIAIPRATAGASSAAVARLAGDISRSLFMIQFRSIAATLAVASGLTLAAGGAYRAAGAGSQPPDPAQAKPKVKTEAPIKAKADHDLAFKIRHENYAQATIGNFPGPAEKDGSAPCREAILYKDGVAKLFEMNSKDPVATFRHDGPIRELSINDAVKLVLTTSDDAVKAWDGLTGEPRKTIHGQIIKPLFGSRGEGARFATLDLAGRVVTLWDAGTLEAVGSVRPEESTKLIGAGLSHDGQTLATISEDRSVTLRDAASGKPFATLRAPSPPIAGVIDDKPGPGFTGRPPVLQLDKKFWEGVRFLLPVAEGPTPTPK